jgi:hypothetical protein
VGSKSFVDLIGDADKGLIHPTQRSRIERLRWLYEFLDGRGIDGATVEVIRDNMKMMFGLIDRTVDDYVSTLSNMRFIVYEGGQMDDNKTADSASPTSCLGGKKKILVRKAPRFA